MSESFLTKQQVECISLWGGKYTRFPRRTPQLKPITVGRYLRRRQHSHVSQESAPMRIIFQAFRVVVNEDNARSCVEICRKQLLYVSISRRNLPRVSNKGFSCESAEHSGDLCRLRSAQFCSSKSWLKCRSTKIEYTYI
jgi:hypothetical protein